MKDYLHNIDILWEKKKEYNHRPLPYPTHDLQVGEYICQVYEIPEEDMQVVIDEINPTRTYKRNINDLYYDGLKNEKFYLKDAMIIRFEDTNHIVSPWFAEYGSSLAWCVKWEPGMKGFGKPL